MEYNEILNRLSKSKFRSSFHLRKYMITYIDEKGLDTVKRHTIDFVNQKLRPAYPKNDGKQTPMKGHPSFVAMHACACCCRSCLNKWHKIPMNKELTENQCTYINNLIMEWIKIEYEGEKYEK